MSSFLAKIRSIQKLSEDEIKNCTPISASWHMKVSYNISYFTFN